MKSATFHMKSAAFHMKSAAFHMKSAAFHMKSTAFREKRRFSKDHLQGIVTLCLFFCEVGCSTLLNCLKISQNKQEPKGQITEV